jgi:hypothetical protein
MTRYGALSVSAMQEQEIHNSTDQLQIGIPSMAQTRAEIVVGISHGLPIP